MDSQILILSEDLFLIPKLEDGAQKVGATVKVVEKPADMGAGGDHVPRQMSLTEPLQGPDNAFIRTIVMLQPNVVIFDLQSESIPWDRWIQVLKTSAASRRIPVLAFGPHIESEKLDLARRLGADEVFTRGKFSASYAKIVSRYLHHSPHAHEAGGCTGELSPYALEGISLHNQGAYFDAHEALEQAWVEASGMEGSLYRVLLQISVLHLHLRNYNLRGALKMCLRMQQWLHPLPALCRGVDCEALREQITKLENQLLTMTQDEVSSYMTNEFKPIHLALS